MADTPRVTVPVEQKKPDPLVIHDGDGTLLFAIRSDGSVEGAGSEHEAALRLVAAMRNIAPEMFEAPEPEGGAADWQPIETALQNGTKIDLWGHWPEHDRWARTPDAVWDEERCDWKVNGFYAGQYAHPPRFTHWCAISGPAALAAREEAPAPYEGITDDCRSWPPEPCGISANAEWHEHYSRWHGRYGPAALARRAATKSSEEAPAEAGEDAEAVVRRWANWIIDESSDMDHDDHDAGKRKVRAERDFILSAIRAQPPAREDAQPVGWTGSGSIDALKAGLQGHMWPTKAAAHPVALYTHPAPDALRAAVEALEQIADEAPYRSGYCQSDVEYAPTLSSVEMQSVARQALAALQAEQGAK